MSTKENITRIMSELLIIDDKIKHLNSKNKELKVRKNLHQNLSLWALKNT